LTVDDDDDKAEQNMTNNSINQYAKGNKVTEGRPNKPSSPEIQMKIKPMNRSWTHF